MFQLSLGLFLGEGLGSVFVKGGGQELFEGHKFVLTKLRVVVYSSKDLSFVARYFFEVLDQSAGIEVFPLLINQSTIQGQQWIFSQISV